MKRVIGVTLATALLISLFGGASFAQDNSQNNASGNSASTSGRTKSLPIFPDFADLVEKVSPAVVNIRTTEKITIQQLPQGFGPQDQARGQVLL